MGNQTVTEAIQEESGDAFYLRYHPLRVVLLLVSEKNTLKKKYTPFVGAMIVNSDEGKLILPRLWSQENPTATQDDIKQISPIF